MELTIFLAPQHERIIGEIADSSAYFHSDLPIVTFIYPIRHDLQDWKVQAAQHAVVRGADVVAVGSSVSHSDAEVVNQVREAAKVPVWLLLNGDYGWAYDYLEPQSIFERAASARDAGTDELVVSNLRFRGRQPSLETIIGGVSEVFRNGKSPEAAYRDASKVFV